MCLGMLTGLLHTVTFSLHGKVPVLVRKFDNVIDMMCYWSRVQHPTIHHAVQDLFAFFELLLQAIIDLLYSPSLSQPSSSSPFQEIARPFRFSMTPTRSPRGMTSVPTPSFDRFILPAGPASAFPYLSFSVDMICSCCMRARNFQDPELFAEDAVRSSGRELIQCRRYHFTCTTAEILDGYVPIHRWPVLQVPKSLKEQLVQGKEWTVASYFIERDIRSVLGRGRFAEVYRGMFRGMIVAVKEMRFKTVPESGSDLLERFVEECDAMQYVPRETCAEKG